MAEPAAGSEFFEARLRRAAALPPAERSPEVAAFVESAALLREDVGLLPLAADGRSPALPVCTSLGARLQVLRAFLKVGASCCIMELHGMVLQAMGCHGLTWQCSQGSS